MKRENIRNFVIIAHVDHGKSTLADRFLEVTKTLEKREMKEQVLDSLESERERGITIKMAPVRMSYSYSGENYELNLIDTPGHADFAYEVSRALNAVEGAILLVDATQGIQAQTLANYETAKRAGLKVIGAVSKVDLNASLAEDAVYMLADLLDEDPESIMKVSGKTGFGVEELLQKVIRDIPAPKVPEVTHSRALIFDSKYDEHKGVIAFVRVFDNSFTFQDSVRLVSNNSDFKVKEVGYFSPKLNVCDKLEVGEIGYIVLGIKDPNLIKIGDTILNTKFISPSEDTTKLALEGYREPQPVIFVSFYPEDPDDYELLIKSLAKLRLQDASLVYEPDKSELLGRGFKIGFLGRLHFEIVSERLEKEFGIITVHSFPSVEYKIFKNNSWQDIKSPKDFPEDYDIAKEPTAKVEIITPKEYIGSILSLREFYRFSDFDTTNIGGRIKLTSLIPLADLISDLDDKLKSVSEGYASLTYEVIGFDSSELSKIEVSIAGHIIPGLTRILPKSLVEREARKTAEKLKDLLPKQQFVQAIQIYAFSRIVARENVAAMRKDVTGYLYGGDRSRKMKLWKKQQEGKARLKERAESHSDIDIPPSVFRELLKK